MSEGETKANELFDKIRAHDNGNGATLRTKDAMILVWNLAIEKAIESLESDPNQSVKNIIKHKIITSNKTINGSNK